MGKSSIKGVSHITVSPMQARWSVEFVIRLPESFVSRTLSGDVLFPLIEPGQETFDVGIRTGDGFVSPIYGVLNFGCDSLKPQNMKEVAECCRRIGRCGGIQFQSRLEILQVYAVLIDF